MSRTLLNKIAFVTGAGSGIGKMTCNILAREGASIIAADKNLTTANETMNDLSNKYKSSDHMFLEIDVSSKSSISTALEAVIKKYKNPPTIIVNCAGVTKDNFLLKMSEQDFDDVININLKGTFLMMQTFANALVASELQGSIINIASIVGKTGNIGQANYSASKSGVEAMTKTASKEFGKFGIRVNAVLPGFIVSPMTEIVPEKVKQAIISQSALRRFGQPEEVAEVIAFLASSRSSYINGASIEVTGG